LSVTVGTVVPANPSRNGPVGLSAAVRDAPIERRQCIQRAKYLLLLTGRCCGGLRSLSGGDPWVQKTGHGNKPCTIKCPMRRTLALSPKETDELMKGQPAELATPARILRTAA